MLDKAMSSQITAPYPYQARVDAIVLGGGDGEVVDPAIPVKGFVTILGKTMIEWVVDALYDAQSIHRIAVVVPDTSQLSDAVRAKADVLVDSDARFVDNCIAGIEAVRDGHHVLGVSADVPAITGEAVDDFVKQTLDAGVDYSYPIIRKEDMESQFPGAQRTYIKIKAGHVTGGNFLLGSPEVSYKVREVFQYLFDTRKNALKMAKVVGPKFAIKMAAGQLEIKDAEDKLSEILGGPCKAVFTNYAAVGADVDKPIDRQITERALTARSSVNN